MKVDIFAGGRNATFTSRILPLVRALENHCVECNVIPPIAWHSVAKGKLGNVLSVVLTHPPCKYADTLRHPPNVVIIGRVSTPQIRLLQKLLKSKGVKTIFDLDDALFLPTGKLFGINVRPGSFCLEEIVKNADFVTVNGHYLLEYARSFNKNSTIINDPVDTMLFSPKSRNNHNKVTIGWEGVPRNHYQNLSILIKPLSRLAKESDIKFKIVSYLGDPKVKQMFREIERFLEIDYGPNYWVPLVKLPELISDFDIMVAPLQKTLWYEGKSALRVSIGMAMGIPVVASPVGEQKYVIKHGVNGFLAKNEEEWYQYLKILIEDEKLREYMGESGRKTVEKELSLQECGRKLNNVLRALEV
ncbi:MAG: glycosyltransferase [Candidatus Bathyarchaeia archaeon]|nr:glycosyltransferase [Candidatus Bathyarchaeia archaeon]